MIPANQAAKATQPGPSPRVQRFFFRVAILIAALLVVDCLTADILRTHGGLRGTDYLILAVASIYLLLALLIRTIARKLAVPIVMSVVTVLVLELALNAFTWNSRAFRWYVWPPNYTAAIEPRGLNGVSPHGTFTINSQGIRGTEFSGNDRVRILCIGASTTECLYLDDLKTWPAVLSQQLNAQQPGAWVGNIGRSGLIALHHATLVEYLPTAAECDVWVVLVGINDMGSAITNRYANRSPRTFERTFSYRAPGWGTPVRLPLIRNFFAVDLLEKTRLVLSAKLMKSNSVMQDSQGQWVRENKLKLDSIYHPITTEHLDEYDRQLSRIVIAARQHNKTLVLVTQPTAYGPQTPDDVITMIMDVTPSDASRAKLAERWRAMNLFNTRLLEVAARENVMAIDLASHMPHRAEFFYDHCHFNEAGAVKVATFLADALGAKITQAGGATQPADR